jgi:hypothetical protein
MHYEAAQIVREALAELHGGGHQASEEPILMQASRWLSRNVLKPVFRLIPWVGESA